MIYKLIVLTLFLVSSTSGKGQVPGGKEVKHLEWTEGKSPTHNFRFNIALSSADKVFVVGGQNDGAIETYDPGTNSWSSLKSMPTERIFISGAVIANSIYVIGGIDRSLNYSAAVESYDITENAWSMCRSLPMAASRLAAVSYRGKIYVFGGLEGTNDTNCENSASVHVYDAQLDTWTRKADMPTPRHGHSAVVVKDKILVIGGYASGPTGVVEEYDPVRDTWTTKAMMPTPRGFFGLVTLGDYAYAIAGRIMQEEGPVERYDIENDQWISSEPIPARRNRFGITTLDGKVYVIGGEDSPQSVLIGELK